MSEEAIPLVPVSDLATSLDWYARLGFATAWEHRPDPDGPALASIVRGDARIFVSEYEEDRSSNTTVFLRFEDLAAVAAAVGGTLEHKPWGEEIRLVDPDGNRLRIGRVRG